MIRRCGEWERDAAARMSRRRRAQDLAYRGELGCRRMRAAKRSARGRVDAPRTVLRPDGHARLVTSDRCRGARTYRSLRRSQQADRLLADSRTPSLTLRNVRQYDRHTKMPVLRCSQDRCVVPCPEHPGGEMNVRNVLPRRWGRRSLAVLVVAASTIAATQAAAGPSSTKAKTAATAPCGTVAAGTGEGPESPRGQPSEARCRSITRGCRTPS